MKLMDLEEINGFEYLHVNQINTDKYIICYLYFVKTNDPGYYL